MDGEMDWHGFVKGMLKAEIKRRNMTYEQVSAKLAEIGVRETPTNLRTKISRGGFSAVFFVATMKAIGVEQVRLADL
jgi:3-mercaptopyruvate sulfurtransferase SseA